MGGVQARSKFLECEVLRPRSDAAEVQLLIVWLQRFCHLRSRRSRGADVQPRRFGPPILRSSAALAMRQHPPRSGGSSLIATRARHRHDVLSGFPSAIRRMQRSDAIVNSGEVSKAGGNARSGFDFLGCVADQLRAAPAKSPAPRAVRQSPISVIPAFRLPVEMHQQQDRSRYSGRARRSSDHVRNPGRLPWDQPLPSSDISPRARWSSWPTLCTGRHCASCARRTVTRTGA